jgi:nucleoside-diphosphate-sugar epimerase
MKVLVLGGSGFLSGTVTREAIAQGHDTWALSRGNKPVPEGAIPLVADRNDAAAFAAAVKAAGTRWDLVVDCIGFHADHARQDIEVFTGRAGRLVFISSDFAVEGGRRPFNIDESFAHYATTPYGKGKADAEKVLQASMALAWTVLRPCHIYGPGSQLGCLPLHGRDARLIDRIRQGETLRLVGGGHFLQQPVAARDVARMALARAGNPRADRRVFWCVGPDIIDSRRYYEIVAEALDAPVSFEEVPVSGYLAEHPDHACFCCHRVYDMTAAQEAGLDTPATPVEDGLREHVAWLLGEGTRSPE